MREIRSQVGDDLSHVGESMNRALDLEAHIVLLREQLAAQPAYLTYMYSGDYPVVLTAEQQAQLRPFLTSIAELEQAVHALWRIVETAASLEFDGTIRALCLHVDQEKLAQWLGRHVNQTKEIIRLLNGHSDEGYRALGVRAVYWVGR